MRIKKMHIGRRFTVIAGAAVLALAGAGVAGAAIAGGPVGADGVVHTPHACRGPPGLRVRQTAWRLRGCHHGHPVATGKTAAAAHGRGIY
jgi:hypothetical protein